MNIRYSILFLSTLVSSHASEPDLPIATVEKESKALPKEAVPDKPLATHETEEKDESHDEVVKMQRFMVVDSLAERALRKKFQNDAQQRKDDQFSFSRGGSMYMNDRIDIGASTNKDLFKEDAKYKDKKPMLKIDFMHLKF